MLIESVKRRCEKVVNGYGATEIPWISQKEIGPGEEFQDFYSGQPFPGVEVKVVDFGGLLLKMNQRDEILIRPPVPYLGYIDEDMKSEKAQARSGWIELGDSVTVTPDGNLIVEGRMSDSVIRASDRLITVSGWEAQLKQHRREICFAILTKLGVHVSDTELRDCIIDHKNHTSDIWDMFLVPENFVLFTSFPMSNTGKVNRKEVVQVCRERLFHRT